MRLKDWFKKHGSTVLTGLGVGGVVGTAACAIYDTKHCKEECPKSFLGKVKYGFKHYYRTILCGSGTVGFILGAHGMSKATERSLVATIASLEGLHNGYRQTAKDILGSDQEELIETICEKRLEDEELDRPPWDEVQTFYLDLPNGIAEPMFFDRTMLQVVYAEYNFNKLFAETHGKAYLDDLYSFLGLEKRSTTDRVDVNMMSGELADHCWGIDFKNVTIQADDGTNVVAIKMPLGRKREKSR